MIIHKFGGTSVGDGERIGRVADLVRDQAATAPVVVVSAMGGVTDRLLETAHLAALDDPNVQSRANYLFAQHTGAAIHAVRDPERQRQVIHELGELFEELKR